MVVWLLALWLGLQKVPERFFPESPFVQKYLSSDVIKAAALSSSLFTLSLIFRDTLSLHSIQVNNHAHTKVTPVAAPLSSPPLSNAQPVHDSLNLQALTKEKEESER